jgi:exonuclease SbcD
MTIAHFSDTHLGFRAFSKSTPHGFNQREYDVMNTFKACLDQIAAAEPDVVVHSGDLFHVVRPSNATIIAAFKAITQFQEKREGRPFILIGGNHDTPRLTEAGNILALFKDIPGMHVYHGKAEALDLPELDLEVMCVPDRSIHARENVDYAPLLGHKHSILVLHGLAQEAIKHSEDLSLAELHEERWTYVALGDFHSHQVYTPNMAYSGSTDYTSTNIWDEKKPKGWILFNTETKKQAFQKLDTRRVLDLPEINALNLSPQELEEKIFKNARWRDEELPIVRQVVTNVLPEMRGQLGSHIQRDLNARALNYQLNLRAPEISLRGDSISRSESITLELSWQAHVQTAQIPGGVERSQLNALGLELLKEVTERASDPAQA